MPLFLSRAAPLRFAAIAPELRQLDFKFNPFPGEFPESSVVLELLHDFRDIRRPDILCVTFAPVAIAQLVILTPTRPFLLRQGSRVHPPKLQQILFERSDFCFDPGLAFTTHSYIIIKIQRVVNNCLF